MLVYKLSRQPIDYPKIVNTLNAGSHWSPLQQNRPIQVVTTELRI